MYFIFSPFLFTDKIWLNTIFIIIIKFDLISSDDTEIKNCCFSTDYNTKLLFKKNFNHLYFVLLYKMIWYKYEKRCFGKKYALCSTNSSLP